jgi:subtilisin-like proprotein convertase family protein
VEVSLTAPDGQTVLLQGRSLGQRTTLQTTYTLRSAPVLRLLLGQPAQGRWQLKVTDYAQGDTGILKTWQLTLGL